MAEEKQWKQEVSGLTREDLSGLLAAAIKAAKEPTEAEQVKLTQQREQQVKEARSQAELARAQEQARERRWFGCPHAEVFNGRKFNKWVGQVNSDGLVKPVCNICHVEAPPFSAKLLPDEGKQGVNFEQWTDSSKDMLIQLHNKTYPEGCTNARCFVCSKKQPQ
jgi:hypothetical protein